MHLADGIEFWIVRKGDDLSKVAPEVMGAILGHRDDKKCLFCGDGHEIGAVIVTAWREPETNIYTTSICVDCAKRDDKKLAERMQQEVSSGFLAHVKMLDELEAMGLLETIGIDPVTGSKRRRLSAKGRELADLEDEAERPSKH